MRRKNRNKKRIKGLSFARLVLILLIIVIGAQITSLHMKNLEVKEKAILIEKQIKEEQENQIELLKKKEHVKTETYIEEVAREKFGLIKPGEIIFIPREEED